MNTNITQHFRRDEHPFIDYVEEVLDRVKNRYTPELTRFLNPREQFILKTLLTHDADLELNLFGGYRDSERKRAFISPTYFKPEQEDFGIEVYEVSYPQKFSMLRHGNILGSLLSLGIRREFYGDIITDGVRFQVMLIKENASYVCQSLQKVGNVRVELKKVMGEEILFPQNQWTEESTTLTSLRLDNLIASVYNISRSRSKALIDANKIQVNWGIQGKSDFLIEVSDVISVRGFGRVRVQEILGETRKGKIRLVYSVLKK